MSYDAVGFLFTPSSSTDVYVGSPVDVTLRNGILSTGGLEEIDDIGYPPKTSGLGEGIVAPRRIWF